MADAADDDGFEVSLDSWKKMWSDGKTEFHSDNIDPFLIDYYQKFQPESGGSVKVFVPLCGKDPGMRFLYEKGFIVVGVEVSEVGCKEFFEDNKIEFTKEDISDEIKLFKSKDGRICLYSCNFFAFSAELCGTFDAVWDRGALNAISVSDQSKYAALMSNLMAKNCINLTAIDASSEWEYLNLAGIKKLYGEGFSVEHVKKEEGSDEYKDLGITGSDLYEIKRV